MGGRGGGVNRKGGREGKGERGEGPRERREGGEGGEGGRGSSSSQDTPPEARRAHGHSRGRTRKGGRGGRGVGVPGRLPQGLRLRFPARPAPRPDRACRASPHDLASRRNRIWPGCALAQAE